MKPGSTTQDILAEHGRGTLSAEMAVTRLLLCHRDLRMTTKELAAIGSAQAHNLIALLESRADAITTILAIANRADFLLNPMNLEAGLEHCRQFFDWAVRSDPESSVALYSLSAPELLAAATQEVVELLTRRGVLRRNRQLLDVGCGIGRVEAALADQGMRIIGIDLSPEMIAMARECCEGQCDTAFHLTSGRDLGFFADASMDAVIAIDSFPYIFQAGGAAFACDYFAEMGRVLKPGGDIVILNLSYRDQPKPDRMDAIRYGSENGLDLLCDGASELRKWDGRTFHWRKPPRQP